jgi:hypothetical protein
LIVYRYTFEKFDGECPNKYRFKVFLWMGQKAPPYLVILSFFRFLAHEKLMGDHAECSFVPNFDASRAVCLAGRRCRRDKHARLGSWGEELVSISWCGFPLVGWGWEEQEILSQTGVARSDSGLDSRILRERRRRNLGWVHDALNSDWPLGLTMRDQYPAVPSKGKSKLFQCLNFDTSRGSDTMSRTAITSIELTSIGIEQWISRQVVYFDKARTK